jgi:hypothetical protein
MRHIGLGQPENSAVAEYKFETDKTSNFASGYMEVGMKGTFFWTVTQWGLVGGS